MSAPGRHGGAALALALALLGPVLVAAAAAQSGDELPGGADCLHPRQAEDARRNLEHLAEETTANEPARVLGDLQPDRSPHPDRATWPGDLVVAGTLLLVNVDLTVCGDVLVLPGAELTLYGANLTVEHPDRDTGSLWAIGQETPTDRALGTGRLAAFTLSAVHEDPRIGGPASELLFAHPDRPAVIQGTEDPLSVQVQGHVQLETDGARLLDLQGLDVASTPHVEIRNTTVESTQRGLYLFDAPGAVVAESTLRAERTALYATTGSDDLRLVDVTLEGREGIQLRHAGDARLEHLTVRAEDRALYAFDAARASLVASALDAREGVYIASSPGAELEANTVHADGTAVTLSGSQRARLAGNALAGEDAGHGIFLDRSSRATVTGNEVRGFANGLENRQADDTTVRCNAVVDNARGAYVTTSHGVALHGNHLTGNQDHALHGYLAGPVDATGNWWGQASGPQPGQVVEGQGTTLDVEPWSEQPPACAPDV